MSMPTTKFGQCGTIFRYVEPQLWDYDIGSKTVFGPYYQTVLVHYQLQNTRKKRTFFRSLLQFLVYLYTPVDNIHCTYGKYF